MNIKKELLIYIVLIVIFAVIQHPDMLTSPMQRLAQLPTAGAYGVGAAHPLVFGLFIYVIVLIFRLIFGFFRRVFTK